MISGNVAPLRRLIRAITSAFLLLRDSVAPFCGRARREAFLGDFFDRVRCVATVAACGATSWDRRWTAFQILATAAFRSVNFRRSRQPSEQQALESGGPDAVYYATQLRGASNQKAKAQLPFRPRPLDWLSANVSATA
jgi:hypothetical protein